MHDLRVEGTTLAVTSPAKIHHSLHFTAFAFYVLLAVHPGFFSHVDS